MDVYGQGCGLTEKEKTMTPNENLTTDEILAKLDRTSRKARTLSLVLTSLLLLILSIVAFATLQAARDLSASQREADEVALTVKGLREEEAEVKRKIEEAKKLSDNNPSCAEVGRALDRIDSSGEILPANITPTPAPSKIPIKINPPPTAQPRLPDNSPLTVYVQIADRSHRNPAKQAIQKIAGGNFKFPGIEFVERKISKTQVRYFHSEDKAKAEELVSRLDGADIPATLVFTSIKAPKHQLEIWFADAAFPQ